MTGGEGGGPSDGKAADAATGNEAAADGAGGKDATADAATGNDAAPDHASDGSGGGDSGESGTTLGMLACDQWALATPYAVENRNGLSPSIYSDLTAFAAGPTTTRVVGALGGGTVFTVFSIDSSAVVPVTSSASLTTGGGTVVATTRLARGFGVVVQTPTGSTASALSLYVFLDAMPVTPLPAPVPLATLTSTTPSNLGAAVVELGQGIYYVAVTAKDSTAGIYELFSGIATGGVAANVTGVDTSSNNDFQLPVAVHVGATIYLYVGSPTGPGFYALPDSGTTAGVTRTSMQGLALGTLFFGGILDGVPGSTSGRTNLAYLEEDANDAAALGAIAYRAAPVDDTRLSTLAASNIAYGKTYTDPALGPFSPSARLFGDDFVAIAPGLTTGGGATAWVNFLWLNVTGVVRGERSGAVQGLLPGRGPFVRRMAPAPGAVGSIAATWNIAWSEYDPNASNSDTLKFNTLICH